jgi:hypothetical protein
MNESEVLFFLCAFAPLLLGGKRLEVSVRLNLNNDE